MLQDLDAAGDAEAEPVLPNAELIAYRLERPEG